MSEHCPKCDGTMKEGFLVDRRQGVQKSLPLWVEGQPQLWPWGSLKIRGRTRHAVVTRRCTKCGYLESYATVPAR
jgi:hypothetical protein